ncbi:MAG: ral secretion pathway protein [Chlamydiia bacterium]|nr:ral secretion pathway protein [Chlamydiia bacterium]
MTSNLTDSLKEKLQQLLSTSLAQKMAPSFFKKKNEALPKKPRLPIQITDEAMRAHAKALGIPVYEDLSSFHIEKHLTKAIPYSFVKKHLFLPVGENETGVIIATYDPFNLDAIEELRLLLKRNIETVFVPKQTILAAVHEYYHQDESASLVANQYKKDNGDDSDEAGIETYDLLDDSSDLPPALQLINYAIADAIQQGASDIHFEPQESNLLIRYRIDGVLQTRLTPSQDLQSQLLTRLKVMAKLDISERRLPQDGRIKMRLGGKQIDFRVSTLPTVTGERIVLRILDKGNVVLGLDKINMPEFCLQEFRKAIDFPEGIILVTGPTGSGKTTTLYSALTELKNDDTNIMTIEDPVEYRLKGIAQIGVHPKIGLTFAAGLRHILRQDPDIIMVGEIRDKETAEIAIQAALTGHLVLSTLHTNDAPSAIVRLVDMGIEPYLISSCVVAVLAQRLVRKICPSCKIAYEPTATELANLGIAATQLYKGKGCPECLNSGFRGRHGIYELMPVTPSIRKQILKSPDSAELQQVALQHGMKTLRDHGKALILQGITTMSEVWRASKGEDEG